MQVAILKREVVCVVNENNFQQDTKKRNNSDYFPLCCGCGMSLPSKCLQMTCLPGIIHYIDELFSEALRNTCVLGNFTPRIRKQQTLLEISSYILIACSVAEQRLARRHHEMSSL